ncbi:MAG TPA: DUF177 domain-containing protein [Stellaceae bacterium]|jgi:uncharacterized metal-binding protein YceD (DUF177 family)
MTAAPEFSRLVSVARLASGAEASYQIAPNEEERRRLAERFGLVDLGSLTAEIRLRRLSGGRIRLDGELAADVVQECVVMLEPFASRVADRFTVIYGEVEEDALDVLLVDGDEELIEPLAGDALDIGEAVAQQLSLVLDPYPRSPGAELPPEAASGGEPAGSAGGGETDDRGSAATATAAAGGQGDEKPNPFAVLAALRKG